jgi:hypothetical protein
MSQGLQVDGAHGIGFGHNDPSALLDKARLGRNHSKSEGEQKFRQFLFTVQSSCYTSIHSPDRGRGSRGARGGERNARL